MDSPTGSRISMKLSPRRIVLFVQAFCCLCAIHRILERDGFAGARRRYLRAWKPRSHALVHDASLVRDVEWAVLQACAWQWKRSVCLHRSLATYALLQAVGARPRFVMAIANRPFASHAWTELDGQPVADATMNESRYLYKPVLCVPNEPAKRACIS